MSAQLYALGRWCFGHAELVLASWLVIVLTVGGATLTFGGGFVDAFKTSGSPSQVALDKPKMTLPRGAMTQAAAILVAPEGGRVEGFRGVIEDTISELEAADFVDSATSPWNERISGMISDDGRMAIVAILIDVKGVPSNEQLVQLTAVVERMAQRLPQGAALNMGGQAFNIELPRLSITEVAGLGVALVVLTLVLGSLVASGLPLLTVVTGMGVTMAVMLLIARLASINSTTPMLAVMLGLAVGIDYALFILSRHRNQLGEGMTVEESAARAVGIAGSAMVFAGLTVSITLLGLGVSGIPFLTAMGALVALAIVLAVSIALTMLPALMGLLGERLRPRSKKPRRRRKPRGGGAFAWWGRVTIGHPVVVLLVVVACPGALTTPDLGLRTALPNSGQHTEDAPNRVTYNLVSQHFGVGRNGPLVLTTDVTSSKDPLKLVADLKEEVKAIDGVAAVPLATPNQDAEVAMLQVVPTTESDDPATAGLIQTLRDRHDQWLGRYGVETVVTSMTTMQIDVNSRLVGALLPFGMLAVRLSLVLLAVVFRSVWAPIKATLGFLLLVGAAFGAAKLVFNDGHPTQMVNLGRGVPVISFLPILLMGIPFGLAMDYEVFLVSRIREEYVHGKKPVDAIRDGMAASGSVVVAAAVTMLSVFTFLIPEGISSVKQIAFVLAVRVAIDAPRVRMTLVPAVMALLRKRAWWLPRWLDKVLPTSGVEGEVLTEKLKLARWLSGGHLLYAEEVAVEGLLPPTSLVLEAGSVISVAGPIPSKTGLALALSGRLSITSGRARVAGELLLGAATAVHRRTRYADLANDPVALSALRPIPDSVAFVDSVETLDVGDERLAGLIDRFRGDGTSALVLCASSEPILETLPVDGVFAVDQSVRSTR